MFLGQRLAGIVGEADSVHFAVLRHEFGQTGLVDGYVSAAKDRELVRVSIDTGHIVAEFRQTCSGHQTDITGSQDAYIHHEFRLRLAKALIEGPVAVVRRGPI